MKDFLFISSVRSASRRLSVPAEPRKRWSIAWLRPLLPGVAAEPLRASNRLRRDLLLNVERPLFILYASKLTNSTNKPILKYFTSLYSSASLYRNYNGISEAELN